MRAMPLAEEVLREATDRLVASPAVEHPHPGKERADAEEILSFVVGHEVDSDGAINASEAARFRRLIGRRAMGEPPAYITGEASFHGLTLRVTRGAFIPRESTEWMAEQAIRRLRSRRGPIHVDMATGIGPVALAVAHAIPRARVVGCDISPRPLSLARDNARRLGLRNVEFRRGDLFGAVPSGLAGRVDVVTLHPPYVGRREMRDLPHEISAFEPHESLTDGSPMGMGLVGRVADDGPRWLRAGGWLLIEVAPDRSRAVSAILRRAGFSEVRSTKGPVPVSRVVVGRA